MKKNYWVRYVALLSYSELAKLTRACQQETKLRKELRKKLEEQHLETR